MRKTIIYVLLSASLALASCDAARQDREDIPYDHYEAYACGTEYPIGGDLLFSTPKLWKDGAEVELEEPYGFFSGGATAVAGYEGKVYVGGYFQTARSAEPMAVVWEDGRPVTFDMSSLPGYSTPEIVDIAAGRSGRAVAFTTTKDGIRYGGYQVGSNEPKLLSGGNIDDADASCIFMEGNSVYVGGSIEGDAKRTACYWKNGTLVKLPALEGYSYYHVTGICVSNGTVYVSGYARTPDFSTYAVYWDGDGVHPLPAPADPLTKGFSSTSGIAVDGADIIIGGSLSFWNLIGYPCYWSNGSYNALSGGLGGFGIVSSTAAAGGETCLGGYVSTTDLTSLRAIDNSPYNACIWHNGALQVLSHNTSTVNDVCLVGVR